MSLHKLRRQLTAANKRVKWYEARFERRLPSRRQRRAYMRRVFERDNIRLRLAMERAGVPKGWEADMFRVDERLRGFHIPLYFTPHTPEEEPTK